MRDIGLIDLGVIIAYVVLVVGLGCWAGFRNRRSAAGSDYFLASRSLTWPVIGLALFSTNISTIHLVSLAQEGYVNGLAYGNFEWMATFLLIILALFFAPLYIRSGVTTLPDFLEKRYSRPCRDFLAIVSILSAIFIHIGFSLYTGAVVLKGMFGIDILVSIIGVSLLTGLYTVIGGLMAVVLTESIQTLVLLAGAICITGIGFYEIGGWSGVLHSMSDDPVKLTILRPSGDPSNLPWYSVLLGYPVIGLWYWCADQTIVQRVLGAKDENHARVGALFTGYIKILPVFIFVLPGLLCLGLVKEGILPPLPVVVEQGGAPGLAATEQRLYSVVAAHPEGAGLPMLCQETGLPADTVRGMMEDLASRKLLKPKTEDVYAHLILNLLPVGLKGLVAAALLAALMSTVSGALNSIATLFSYDICKRWRPDLSDRTLIRIGRVVTVIGMIVAILWSPLLSRFPSIFQGITAMICYIAPPITAVFLWGLFWPRASAKAALTTLWSGFAAGLVVFFIDWNKEAAWMKAYVDYQIPFMMMTFYLFLGCSAVLAVGSWISPHRPTAESEALVWRHPLNALRGESWSGVGNYKFLAALLLVVMLTLYYVFS